MDGLTRFPLSCILSYLSETEGTSFLITRKRYANQILPLFRRSIAEDGLVILPSNGKNNVNPSGTPKHRHRFARFPIQDATVLLARLNTRRLRQRQKQRRLRRMTRSTPQEEASLIRDSWNRGSSTVELARLECRKVYNVEEEKNETTKYVLIPQQVPCLLRFLNATERDQSMWGAAGTTLLASYPRSGNTLVRTLLEKITGLVTGSDTRPNRNLSRELAERHDLVGEGVTSHLFTPFVKTHWPERVGCTPFAVRRVIMIVRNPYDAMDSYWNMNATCSHTRTVTDEVYQQFGTMYNDLIRNEIQIWMKFHQYWLEQQQQQQSNVPVLVIRFEDLIMQPSQEMQKILHFTFPTANMTLIREWNDRINQVVLGNNIDQLGSYQPRTLEALEKLHLSSSTATNVRRQIGKSLDKGRYSSSLLDYIHTTCADQSQYNVNYLQEFGYDIYNQNFPKNMNTTIHTNNHDGATDTSFLHGSNPQEQVNTDDLITNHACYQVNEGNVIRRFDCPFGRNLTYWRHSVTDQDRQPLPTVQDKQGI